MEKRRHQRMAVTNLTVDISDGIGFFAGTVGDLSRFGLMVNDIPKMLDEKAPQLSVVITGNGKHFKMKARPRWSCRQSINKKVGIEVMNAPWGWTEFVMDLEPKNDDTWDTINL